MPGPPTDRTPPRPPTQDDLLRRSRITVQLRSQIGPGRLPGPGIGIVTGGSQRGMAQGLLHHTHRGATVQAVAGAASAGRAWQPFRLSGLQPTSPGAPRAGSWPGRWQCGWPSRLGPVCQPGQRGSGQVRPATPHGGCGCPCHERPERSRHRAVRQCRGSADHGLRKPAGPRSRAGSGCRARRGIINPVGSRPPGPARRSLRCMRNSR